MSALDDMSAPAFASAPDKQSFVDSARGLISGAPNSDEAKVFRALLTALGETP